MAFHLLQDGQGTNALRNYYRHHATIAQEHGTGFILESVSEELELIDVGKRTQHAITGGTGPFKRARGQITQTFLSINDSEGFTLRFELEVK